MKYANSAGAGGTYRRTRSFTRACISARDVRQGIGGKNMQIGQKVRVRVTNDRGTYRAFDGVIVWVHPRGRFALVEYKCGQAVFRGAFAPWDMRAIVYRVNAAS